MPPGFPLLRDPAFVRDRVELAGDAFGRADRAASRAQVEAALGEVEGGFLADGRAWVVGGGGGGGGGEGPTLCDLQGVWVFDWLLGDAFFAGAVDEAWGWERRFPRAVAWVRRWREVLGQRGVWDHEREGPRGAVGDEEVLGLVFGGEGEGGVEVVWDGACAEAVGLERGQVVEVFPTDYGSKHRDRGRLVGLGVDEVVIEVDVEERGKALRVHFPRTGFRVRKVE